MLSACHNFKTLPEGLAYAGKPQAANQVQFFADQTWVDNDGHRHVQQEVFDEVFELIGQAQRFILLDMFLYNDFQGPVAEQTRALSQELTQALVAQKQRYPALELIVITDPINNVYGGLPSTQLQQLRDAGIQVVITDLEQLKDSNAVYSFFWRLFIKPFGTSSANTLPSPFGGGRVSIRSDLRLLNFKANHRKILIADSPKGYVGLVTSANPHDGSSAHRNVAVKFSGAAVVDLLNTEKTVLALSGASAPAVTLTSIAESARTSVQVLTERKIKHAVLQTIDTVARGDRLDLMMFYLADRDIVKALKRAHQRGVAQRILLDPNKDAFGRKKNGIPNRPVAHELHKVGIPIKWCDTHGEQCHAKMLISHRSNGASTMITGSANFTRRNLENYNLETDVLVTGVTETPALKDAQAYFDLMWHNSATKNMSVDYAAYADKSLFKRWLYRFMEASGVSTF
ncbi:MAG: phospholipase D-like domain-containing protein [Pseudomonadales bacterium]